MINPDFRYIPEPVCCPFRIIAAVRYPRATAFLPIRTFWQRSALRASRLGRVRTQSARYPHPRLDQLLDARCHDGRSLMWSSSRMGPVRHRGWRAFKIERISGADLSAVVYQTAPTFAHARLIAPTLRSAPASPSRARKVMPTLMSLFRRTASEGDSRMV